MIDKLVQARNYFEKAVEKNHSQDLKRLLALVRVVSLWYLDAHAFNIT